MQNLAVPTLPYSDIRDSLSLPTMSSDESAISAELRPSKSRGVKSGTKEVVMSLAAEIGKGNGEWINIMKEGNEQHAKAIQQNQKLLAIADGKLTKREAMDLVRKEMDLVKKEMDLSKLLSMHEQSLTSAREQLSKLKGSLNYDSDSSEAREAKSCVHVLSIRYNRTLQSLEKHSS